jgi:glycosyltransferase involved in cell wall biosynthesis
LFQYHPHPDLETRILEGDSKHYPGYGESFAAHDDSIDEALVDRERNSWRHADTIICSSAFTRRSLVEAGCDARICHVVPYGVFAVPQTGDATPSPGFNALFVGSGGQRKGLHHLLLAWTAARPRADWRLTIVSRVIDRGIRELASRTPNVEMVAGATPQDLEARYASSTLFVMPSLVEGFGHVYLEALARGCPVLGTANTALPDLGTEDDGIFLIEAGQVEQLAARLMELGQRLPGDALIRNAARATAGRFPWSAFRAQLRSALHA